MAYETQFFEKALSQLPGRVGGHLWTVIYSFKKPQIPTSESTYWEYWFDEPGVGRVGIHGRYVPVRGAKKLAVVIHGLGGCPESNYVVDAASSLYEMGISTLRLGLRGSAGLGNDLYSAGCISDLFHAISHPLFDTYEEIYLVGYSLGGHIALLAGTEMSDKRIKGVVAVCAPLDLNASANVFESLIQWPYRRHVLKEMNRMYRVLSHERIQSITPEEANFIRTLRSWDEAITVQRWGFESSQDYYDKTSVGFRLEGLRVPAIFVYTLHDPMVLYETLRPYLEKEYKYFISHGLEEGGHVYFPDKVDLGVPGIEKRLFPQAIAKIDTWQQE